MEGDLGSVSVSNTFMICVKENPSYLLSIRGEKVILAPKNISDISQYWVQYYKQHKCGIPTFVLVNRYSGRALKQPSYSGQHMQLDTYKHDDDDDQLLWTEREFPGNEYKNIVSIDEQNLVLEASLEDRKENEIFSGNLIVLGKYKDADRNQMWKLTQMDINCGGVFAGLSF